MGRPDANGATNEPAHRPPARTSLSTTRRREELDLFEMRPAVGVTGDAHDDPYGLADERQDGFLHLLALVSPGRGRVLLQLVRGFKGLGVDRLEPLADV